MACVLLFLFKLMQQCANSKKDSSMMDSNNQKDDGLSWGTNEPYGGDQNPNLELIPYLN